jgi:alkylation response protein AidB-like acyl-CoA dehydrogenase
MDFQPTDDRRLLRDTLTRYLAEQYPLSHRNAVAYNAPFHDPAKWAEMAELGVLHALVPETQGGLGGAGFDIMTVFEALGAGLCPEPFLAAVMAVHLLGSGDLEPLLAGHRYGVGLSEVSAQHGTLSGRLCVVYGGGSADTILGVANGALFQIAAKDAKIIAYGMIDGGGAAEVFLDATPATCLNNNADLTRASDAGALALCAEAIGAMDVSFAMLTDYLKTRKQFGQTIGSFQAIQHRVVDLMTEIEQARSITILAASRFGTDGQSRAISMAKSLVGRVAQQMSEELIQLHGGIAMTWDHPASHYAKRLVMIDHQLGNSDAHLTRVASHYHKT